MMQKANDPFDAIIEKYRTRELNEGELAVCGFAIRSLMIFEKSLSSIPNPNVVNDNLEKRIRAAQRYKDTLQLPIGGSGYENELINDIENQIRRFENAKKIIARGQRGYSEIRVIKKITLCSIAESYHIITGEPIRGKKGQDFLDDILKACKKRGYADIQDVQNAIRDEKLNRNG